MEKSLLRCQIDTADQCIRYQFEGTERKLVCVYKQNVRAMFVYVSPRKQSGAGSHIQSHMACNTAYSEILSLGG